MFSLKPATCESVSQYFICKLIGSYQRQKSLKTSICSWSFKYVGTKSEESRQTHLTVGCRRPQSWLSFSLSSRRAKNGRKPEDVRSKEKGRAEEEEAVNQQSVLMCLCMLRLHIISVIKAAVSLQRRDWNSHRVTNKEEIKIIYNDWQSYQQQWAVSLNKWQQVSVKVENRTTCSHKNPKHESGESDWDTRQLTVTYRLNK